MIALIAAAAIQTQAPQDLLLELRDRYARLRSYSATIVHEDSSGLFPGAFEQKLRWRKGGAFDLVVTKPADIPRKAPDYYSNGKTVTVIRGAERGERPIDTGLTVVSGWEVTGGLALGWLMKTPTSDYIFKPPTGYSVAYEFGPAAEWGGQKAVEVVATISKAGQRTATSIFVSADRRSILGMEWRRGDQTGRYRYLDQAFDPALPPSLGTPPKR